MARPIRKWWRKLKRLNNVRKRRNQAKIRAAKKAATAQTRITRESRKTAGELRASGAFEWQGSGMPDNTVMEPVRAEGGGWEWVPVMNKQGKPLTRRPAAMSNARHDQEPFIALSGPDTKIIPGNTTAGALRARGYDVLDEVPNTQPVTVMSDGNAVVQPGTTPETSDPALMDWLKNASAVASGSKKCNAPTKDKTPCERLGDCPIPSHKRWRKANGR